MTTTCPTANREVQRPNDTTIRYAATGPADGPVLVLVHGWGCDRTDFDALIGFLPGHHRVLAVDLAGHGESRSAREDWTVAEFARDVAAVLAAESVDTCVVAGHSMGGAVAVETARLLPAVVTRVVALDALHYLALFPAQQEQQVDAVVRAFHEDFAAATRAMVASGSPEGTDPAAQEAYFERMVAVPRQVGLGAIEGLVRWDMDSALREVRQPITVFAVREILVPEAVERYGDRLRIVPVDLGSHHFHVESPQATAALLADA
ncbi:MULTISPECIES: alpha/beta fold hydrolase [unclassified Saccharopolyspora]|uniref:alpha/beta fold hydrolase n=1 Tax=unclassified Saccharopolyspora TaxID=2646250 RepID=UPI001CD52F45|nr:MULTISPECIES: alpha/beta hydrolase [unclassified Saccharopolyspora]MCA1192603.1 alpha/beta hydrolase [Saccharopolyspora sp. 6V]MCA1226648.1 alpha/beta hydrolase [Saccharopolyspora sp. 6M]